MLRPPSEPTHVIGICGGAVAGSEAAALAAERGAIAIVFDQNARPYGKIEDGLPRWHVKLRHQEYGRIDDNLDRPNVLFVPCTRLGRDLAFRELTDSWGLNAVVLATGAWRDRPLPVEIHRFDGRGLVYQNPFVHWFNHAPEASYDGVRYEVPNRVAVVGGGLASIDVVKIVNLELYRKALAARGIEIGIPELEHQGIAATLEAHGIEPDELGIEGATLYYRRRKKDMPLTPAPNPTPEQLAKLEKARIRIMEKVERKYLVRMEELCTPAAPIEEDGRLAGLVFHRTEVVDGRVRTVEGQDFEVRCDLVISSIGSIPEPVEGLPMRGELIHFHDWDTGEVEGMAGVYGLGNALTGRGNIKESRANARQIAEGLMKTWLGGHPDPAERQQTADVLSANVHGSAQDRAASVVDEALADEPLSPERIRAIYDRVETLWQEAGYDGDYRAWIERATPPDAP